MPVFPNLVADAGERVRAAFDWFFVGTIRSKNTRSAHAHAVARFLLWCEKSGHRFETIQPVVVATYVEKLAIENAQAIAAHESPRTTTLYDRTSDEIALDEVERIEI